MGWLQNNVKYQLTKKCLLLVYVIVWVAVVFGINCALLLFPACITSAINSKYYRQTILLQINPICLCSR